MIPNSFIKPSCLFVILLGLQTYLKIFASDLEQPNNKVQVNKESSCEDFLGSLNRKPAHLEFVECKKVMLHGDPALESRYRVKGAEASAIEAYFIKTAHMPALRHMCCGWESLPKDPKARQPSGFYESDQKTYLISMDSGETLVTQRAKWNAIPYFNVTVTLYQDTP